MPDSAIYRELTRWAGENAWIVQVFVVVFAALLCSFLLRRVLKRLHERLKTTANLWDDALISAMQGPALLLVWVVGLTFAVDIVYAQTRAAIFTAVGPLRQVGVVCAITWFLMRLTRHLQDRIAGKAGKGAWMRPPPMRSASCCAPLF